MKKKSIELSGSNDQPSLVQSNLVQASLERASKDQELSNSFDVLEPQTEPANDFAIVGIGASAGGMAAFEAFFSGIPPDTEPEMAFVIVQHLSPEHKSLLADLLQRHTHLPVVEAEDGMTVNVNCVYIIPPNRDMALLNGTLQLLEHTVPRGKRTAVDFFFSSLAQDQHERAIGILLSGAGSDGTQGVRAIKAEGGMVIAQNQNRLSLTGWCVVQLHPAWWIINYCQERCRRS